MDMKLEVVPVPESEVECSKGSYESPAWRRLAGPGCSSSARRDLWRLVRGARAPTSGGDGGRTHAVRRANDRDPLHRLR